MRRGIGSWRLKGVLRLLWLVLAGGGLSFAQDDVAWDDSSLESKASLKIESKLKGGSWKSGSLSVNSGTAVGLRIKGVSDDAEIRWYQIIPDVSKYYKNANHPWEANAYKWAGFGEIDYIRREITDWRNQTEIDRVPQDVFRLKRAAANYRYDLGSFWLDVEVMQNGKRKRTAGLQENTDRNLSPSVFRLTVRKDDSYLGHLSGFFNVPGLFGSIPFQSSHYIGVDCADVLVAARRKWRGLEGAKDYNVSMLVNAWPTVAKFSLSRGKPTEGDVRWGDKVKPGDLIAVKYAGRTRYQHIGALYEDKNENGLLDGADLIIHAGPDALHLTPLRRGSFDGVVAILRPPK